MNTKTWLIFGGVVVALLGGLIVISQQGKVSVDDINANSVLAASEASGNIADHAFGNASSKVILFEYGDFQCPGCQSAAPVMKQVKEKYADQIAFVFRNFPLVTMHPNAKAAAAAAEAAGKQGKYWEMHYRLFDAQNSWGSAAANKRTDIFVQYAQDIGVADLDTFKADLASAEVAKKISFDMALGSKLGASGTPAFFLGNEKIDQYFKDGALVDANTDGARQVWTDADAFGKLIIEPALKKAGIALPETAEAAPEAETAPATE